MKTKFFLSLLVCFFTLIPLFASDDDAMGRIAGTIIDAETKQPIAGVKIAVIKTKLGAYADTLGKYNISNVPVGRYTVYAIIPGYKSQTVSDIIVVPQRTALCNFELMREQYKADEIVVQADRFDKTSSVSINSTTSIDNQEISRTPGIPDVFRRLQSVAGVGRSDESSAALIVRGGDPEENLTLIENVEVFSPFHFASLGAQTSGGMSIIEPKLVQNVNISTGGFGAMYGDRLSSVARITLEEPEKNRVNGDVSLDMAGASAFFSGPLASNASWMIAGRRGILDLLLSLMDQDFKPKTWDFHTKVLYEPSSDHQISFYGMVAQDKITGSSKDGDSGDVSFSTIQKTQSAVGINWRWLFSDKGYLLTTPYLNTNSRSLTFGSQEDRQDNSNRNKENYAGIKTELFYRINDTHRFSIGGDFKHISVEYAKREDQDTLSTGVIVPASSVLFQPDNTWKSATYAQYYYDPLPWVALSAGLRQDYFSYTGETTVSPRASASLTLDEQWSISASWGIFTQSPQFYKIFSSDDNRKLTSARAIHYITGVEYLLTPDMQLKVEGYYKALSHLPVTDADTGTVFRNTGSGYAAGVEMTFTHKMNDHLSLLLNYSYSVSKRKDSTNGELYNFRFDRPHAANLMATYRLSDWWEFGLICSYATGVPYTPYNLSTKREIDGQWYADLGAKNSERFPDYFRVDARIDRRFIFSSWNLRVYLEVWNLTNHENVFEYQYSHDFTEVKKNVLFPLMPMIGIAAGF